MNTSAVCGGCDVTAKGLDDVSVGAPWFFSVGDLHRVAERWKESEKSRRAAAGRAELLARRGCICEMQISAELVPIPDASGCVPDAS